MTGAFELTVALGGRWHGRYGTARCVAHDDRNPSMSIRDGERGAILKCHAGCDWRDIRDALGHRGLIEDWRRHHQGDCHAREPARMQARDYENRQREKARYLWSQRRPIQGTPVEAYLRSRGIYFSPLPSTLGYLPPLKPEHHHAMIACYGHVDEPAAVHLTLLRPDGSGKADVESPKLTIASPQAMPIVLAPPDAERRISICEGIEDAVTTHVASGIGAWAAGAAAFMPALANTVSYRHRVLVCGHNDGGRRYAMDFAHALDARGIVTRVEGLQ
jgi:hypothetical protein